MTISPGAAAGLAIGATLDIILIFGMVYYYYRQRRQRILDDLAAQQAQHDQEAAVAVASQIRRHHYHHHQEQEQQRYSRDPANITLPRSSHSQGQSTPAEVTAETLEAGPEPDQESTDTGCYSRAASLDQRIMTWRDQSSNMPGSINSRSSRRNSRLKSIRMVSRSVSHSASHSRPASLTSPFSSAEDPVELPVQRPVELEPGLEDYEKSELRRSESGNGRSLTPSATSHNDDVSSLSLNDCFEKRSMLSSLREKVSLAQLSVATTKPSRSSSRTERQGRGQEGSQVSEAKSGSESEAETEKAKDVAEVVGIQLSPIGDSFTSMMLGSGYDPTSSSGRTQRESVTTNTFSTNTSSLNPFAALFTSTNNTNPSSPRTPTVVSRNTTTRTTDTTPSQSPSSINFTQISATPPTLPPPAWTRESASLPISLFTQWNRSRSSGIGGLGQHEREQRGGGGGGYWVL